jgi:hypothetical protein
MGQSGLFDTARWLVLNEILAIISNSFLFLLADLINECVETADLLRLLRILAATKQFLVFSTNV